MHPKKKHQFFVDKITNTNEKNMVVPCSNNVETQAVPIYWS